MAEIFTVRVRELVLNIPPGKVMTYGLVAARAGNRSGARQVARILHSSSDRYALPWHRVVNREGKISLPRGGGYELQQELLEEEGVFLSANGRIDLKKHLWLAADLFAARSS